MNNLNSILIEGNLVKDPLLRSTPKGTQVCTMCIASNRFFKQNNQDAGFEKEVSFFDVETWSKLAEACYAKGRKGRGVRVVGRLKQDRWNSPDGKFHSRVTIIAEHVEFRPDFKKESSPVYETEHENLPVLAAEPEILYDNTEILQESDAKTNRELNEVYE
ncbi:MAG: single-stranded DNA-binding protein [Treponema sp.]|nr:single-stranded DNA-binding protein [Treponema sp.]MCL2250570.1 single-stranded DNA-binding protein [Treponema sp.]